MIDIAEFFNMWLRIINMSSMHIKLCKNLLKQDIVILSKKMSFLSIN